MTLKYQHRVDDLAIHANISGEKGTVSQDEKIQGRVLICLAGSESHPFYQSHRPSGLMLLSAPVTSSSGAKAPGKQKLHILISLTISVKWSQYLYFGFLWIESQRLHTRGG